MYDLRGEDEGLEVERPDLVGEEEQEHEVAEHPEVYIRGGVQNCM